MTTRATHGAPCQECGVPCRILWDEERAANGGAHRMNRPINYFKGKALGHIMGDPVTRKRLCDSCWEKWQQSLAGPPTEVAAVIQEERVKEDLRKRTALQRVSLDDLKSELARRNLVCKHCYDLDLIKED